MTARVMTESDRYCSLMDGCSRFERFLCPGVPAFSSGSFLALDGVGWVAESGEGVGLVQEVFQRNAGDHGVVSVEQHRLARS